MAEEVYDHIMTNEQCLKLIEKVIKTNKFELLNYSLKPLDGVKKGFLATHLKGSFDIKCKEETQTLKFFMKLKLDANDALSKLANDSADVYTRESTFLKLVTNDFQVPWAPKFYDYIDNKLIILEDLSERGFKIVDSEEFDLNHCYVALNALAKLHAFSFKFVHDKRLENDEYSILKEYPDSFKELLFTNETETGRKFVQSKNHELTFIIDEMQPTNVEKVKEKFHEIYARLLDFMKPKENKYHVISHGDLWANNIMFSYQNNVPIECCVVDFQTLRYMSPTFDLQFFLAITTAPSLRTKHYRELLEYYYKQLSSELNLNGLDSKDVYPKEIFERNCTETFLTTLVNACASKAYLCIPKSKIAAYIADPIIFEELLFGDRTKYTKEELETNATYKEKIYEEFQVLIDEIEKLL